jgi:N-acetylneuraminate synthase
MVNIIAEAGVNHNGDIKLAYQLIDVAHKAGADYIKFQTFIPDQLVSNTAPKAEYQNKSTSSGTQIEMLEKLALTHEQFGELSDYCKKVGIGFLSTGFDERSVRFIDSLNVDFHKVPSGEITNLPYLRLIGSLGKKVILSTGMANLDEIREAIHVLCQNSITLDDIIVLQCTTEYPAPLDEVNLSSIASMKDLLGVKTGFSDHTQGIEIAIAAAAIGAVVIEKHFTISRNMPGPDHQASLEPHELTNMVTAIRNVEKAMGKGHKVPMPSEIKNIEAARRSIHLSKNLPKGHVLSDDDLIMKRPGNGISPMMMEKVIGRQLNNDLSKDTLLEWVHLSEQE